MQDLINTLSACGLNPQTIKTRERKHVIKVNGQVQTIKKSYTEIIKLENGSTIHFQPNLKHIAKEVFKGDKGRFTSKLSILF